MYYPPLPATTSPKSACQPEWDLTAIAQLSAEQFHLRSSPGYFLTNGRWLKPDGNLLELPGWKFQVKSGANTPTIGETNFTRELHLILHNKLCPSPAANYRKQNEMSAEQAWRQSAAKTSDEAGATPLCRTVRYGFRGVAPASPILGRDEEIAENDGVISVVQPSWRPNERRLLFATRNGTPWDQNLLPERKFKPLLKALGIQ
jgi:hypothetical protein